MGRTHRAVTAVAALVTATLVLAGGGVAAPEAGPAAAPRAAASTPPVIDIAALPLGASPRTTWAVGRELHWRGRAIRADAALGTFLGVAGGRLVLERGPGFWAVDRAGHVSRLGGDYQSYDYAPALVERTGHLWVHYEDRTTPRTIWEIDARTGEEIASYPHDEVPRGLAPADQALTDAWVQRRSALPDTEAHDGRLVARTRARQVDPDTWVDTVVVRRAGRADPLASFTFARPHDHGVERVLFEDPGHVLVLTALTATRRSAEQVVVRCAVAAGTCERATPVDRFATLGIDRPEFAGPGAR